MFTAWELESTDSGQTTTYYWLANEGKLPVAEISNSGKLTWTLVPAIPIADFSHNPLGGGDVEFTNLSINSPSYTWDFGDSSPQSSDVHPVHTYLTNGTFNVCLTATNVSGTDAICHDVMISTVTSLVENNQAGRLMVYPNPSEGYFVFESEAKMKSISISSVIGEKVWYEEIEFVLLSIRPNPFARGSVFLLYC
jgi:PKD repeat protein